MANHMHLIVNSESAIYLADVIRNYKRFAVRTIYETLKNDRTESRENWLLWIFESQGKKSSSNTNSKIWRHQNHPVILDNNSILDQRLEYIHQNPVRAGICYTTVDYKYSSARQYDGEGGLLSIELV